MQHTSKINSCDRRRSVSIKKFSLVMKRLSRALKDEADATQERLDYLQSLNILLQQAVKDLGHDLGVA